MTHDISTLCQVLNEIPSSEISRITLCLRPNQTVEDLYTYASTQLGTYDIELLLDSVSNESSRMDEQIESVGVCWYKPICCIDILSVYVLAAPNQDG